MTKVCDECGKPISLFGGSWNVNGKTVCSKCEQKIRLAREIEKKEEINSEEKPEYLKKDDEIGIIKKYCIECGNELPGDAKFCISCGKQQIEQVNKEVKEHVTVSQESTGPAALDLKTAYNLVSETRNILDDLKSEADNQSKNGLEVDVFEKRIVKKMENDLKTADGLAKKVKNIDPNIVIKDTSTNKMITCDHVISESCFLMGVIGLNFVFYQGRRNIDANKRIIRRAQLNFIESNSIMPTDYAQYYIALSMDAQTEGIIRVGEFILDINGKKIFLTPLSSKKAKRIAYDAYQRVIDLYPESDLAVESRKSQTELRV